jgi:flavin reductase (DIM6/NTAB) family NADH-FMN oxidoreductase RutF
MSLPIKRLFFKENIIRTFQISRLTSDQIEEKVFLKKGDHYIEISQSHGMICLDPFCMAVWLPNEQIDLFDLRSVKIQFKKGGQLNASIQVSLIEKIGTEHGVLILYKIEEVKNYQLSALHRLVLFGYLLRSKKNTYHHRKVISALYSYPRSIIIVSFQDDEYYNIFPMDIHAYIKNEDMYILGLRTTNVTLDKILKAGKVVVCDTDSVDINTVYNLGKHPSAAPTPIHELPFGTTGSELFGFPIPDFVGSYKEIEIIQHKKMGYHMLLVGKVVNKKMIRKNPSSLHHISFLQFKKGNYKSIEGLY